MLHAPLGRGERQQMPMICKRVALHMATAGEHGFTHGGRQYRILAAVKHQNRAMQPQRGFAGVGIAQHLKALRQPLRLQRGSDRSLRPAAFPEIRQNLRGPLPKARNHPFHHSVRHGGGIARLASEPVEAVDRDQPGAIRRKPLQPEERAQ